MATCVSKLETFHPTGSFKLRGAMNALLALREEHDRVRGVVTYSTGNHGTAVAFTGAMLGVPVTVCVAESVPESKLRALRASDAELHVEGATQDEAAVVARAIATDQELELIDPLTDHRVIAGHGTIGLELAEQIPELDIVLVPVSAGGLIGGIASTLKTLRPRIRVIGLCAAHAPAMFDSVRAGHPVVSNEKETLADSLRGGIDRYALDLVTRYVDDLVLVHEEEIAEALVHALRREGLVIEGAAAVGFAALLEGSVDVSDACAAVVVSGRNIDVAELARLDEELG